MDFAVSGLLFGEKVLEEARRLLANPRAFQRPAQIPQEDSLRYLESLENKLKQPLSRRNYAPRGGIFDEEVDVVKEASVQIRDSSGNWVNSTFQLMADGKLKVVKSQQSSEYEFTYAECVLRRLEDLNKGLDCTLIEQNLESIEMDSKSEMIEEEKNGELVICRDAKSYLKFQVYHVGGQIYCKAKSLQEAKEWITILKTHVRDCCFPEVWREKCNAFSELVRIQRDKTSENALRYANLMHSLNDSGIYSDNNVPRRILAEQSGNVFVETEFNSEVWTNYFAVLEGKSIVFYDSTQVEKPKDIYKLKYCFVAVDSAELRRGTFIIKLQSAAQKLRFKCKHVVQYAEWISRIYHAMMEDSNAKIDPDFANSVIKRLYNLKSNLSCMSELAAHDAGMVIISDFLTQVGIEKYCSFIEDVQKYKKTPLPARIDHGSEICFKYLRVESPDFILDNIDANLIGNTLNSYVDAKIDIFDRIVVEIMNYLNKNFFEKIQSDERFIELRDELKQPYPGTEVDDAREHKDLPANLQKVLVILSNENSGDDGKQAKEAKKIFKFSSSRNALTIGREHSFDVCIMDTHVSRCHARIVYNSKCAVFYDLGSSAGSKFEGKSILKLHLQLGDKIQLGKTEICFSLQEFTSPKANQRDSKGDKPENCTLS